MDRTKKEKMKLTIRDITLIGIMVAVIEVCKVALGFLPNIELTSFWIIMFTLSFGWRIIFVIPVFILIEISMYGLHVWVIMYLYAWPLLALITWIFRKQNQALIWAIISGFFGLGFGLLCSIPYVVIGAVGNTIWNGIYAGFTWWIAGIPWDITHCIGNFVLMFVLFKPITRVMNKVKHSVL